MQHVACIKVSLYVKLRKDDCDRERERTRRKNIPYYLNLLGSWICRAVQKSRNTWNYQDRLNISPLSKKQIMSRHRHTSRRRGKVIAVGTTQRCQKHMPSQQGLVQLLGTFTFHKILTTANLGCLSSGLVWGMGFQKVQETDRGRPSDSCQGDSQQPSKGRGEAKQASKKPSKVLTKTQAPFIAGAKHSAYLISA